MTIAAASGQSKNYLFTRVKLTEVRSDMHNQAVVAARESNRLNQVCFFTSSIDALVLAGEVEKDVEYIDLDDHRLLVQFYTYRIIDYCSFFKFHASVQFLQMEWVVAEALKWEFNVHAVGPAVKGIALKLSETEDHTTSSSQESTTNDEIQAVTSEVLADIVKMVDKWVVELTGSDILFLHWPSYIAISLFIKVVGTPLTSHITRMYAPAFQQHALSSTTTLTDTSLVEQKFLEKLTRVSEDLDVCLGRAVCGKVDAQRIDKILQACKDQRHVVDSYLYKQDADAKCVDSDEECNGVSNTAPLSNIFD